MSLLMQQELVEPAPLRRMIVPRGAEAHWGVDTAVRAVSVASVRGGREEPLRRCVVTVPLPKLDGGRRLAWAFETVRDAMRVAIVGGGLGVPGFVFVEQPSGKTPNPQLSYMVGVVMGAVYSGAVLGALDVGVHVAPTVETVASSSWKKVACGFGAIYKPTREKLGRTPSFMDYRVAVWARENGYEGLSWDEADATGMAEAARRTVALEPR